MEVFDNIAGTIKTNLLAVIGGFHLYNPVTHKYESKQRIKDIADWLNKIQKNTTLVIALVKKA